MTKWNEILIKIQVLNILKNIFEFLNILADIIFIKHHLSCLCIEGSRSQAPFFYADLVGEHITGLGGHWIDGIK